MKGKGEGLRGHLKIVPILLIMPLLAGLTGCWSKAVSAPEENRGKPIH